MIDVVLEIDHSETSPGSRTCSYREASQKRPPHHPPPRAIFLETSFLALVLPALMGGSVQSTGTSAIHLYLCFTEVTLDL